MSGEFKDSLLDNVDLQSVGNFSMAGKSPRDPIRKIIECLNQNRSMQKHVLGHVRIVNGIVHQLSQNGESGMEGSLFKSGSYFSDSLRKCPKQRFGMSYRLLGGADKQYSRKWCNRDDQKLKSAVQRYIKLGQTVGSKSVNIDYDRISKTIVKNHSPIQCQLRWTNYLSLHKDHFKWRTEENRKLLEVARKHNFRNWERISTELGGRNSFQTFVHFRRNLSHDSLLEEKMEEIRKLDLRVAIEKTDISSDGAFRRKYTEKQDQLLAALADKFGIDGIVSYQHLFANRSAFLLRKHYEVMMERRDSKHDWTTSQDLELIRLHEKFDGRWEKIATVLGFATPDVCRNRYNFLVKNQREGKWWLGLVQEPRRSYTSHAEAGSHLSQEVQHAPDDPPPIAQTDAGRQACAKSEMQEFQKYKREWALTFAALGKKIRAVMDKNKSGGAWEQVLKVMKECQAKVLVNLRPDMSASCWRTRAKILNKYNRLPKRSIHSILERLQVEPETPVRDANSSSSGCRRVYGDNFNVDSLDDDCNLTEVTLRLFGEVLFLDPIKSRRNPTHPTPELDLPSDASVTAQCHSEVVDGARIDRLLAKNEMLLQQTDLSRFERNKRKRKQRNT